MPRTLPIANGNLHVSFDYQYCVRDIYHNHLGLNNQTGGVAWRLGIWVDGQISWIQDDEWERRLVYESHDSLVTNVRLTNKNLQIEISVNDAIAPDDDVLVRKFRITNRAENECDVRLFLNSRFRIEDNADSVAVYYDPERRAIFHYKADHWFCERGTTDGTDKIGVGQFTTGEACPQGSWGTWQDAEDGWLEGQPVAQGEADSTFGLGTKAEFGEKLGAGETATVYYWLVAADSHEAVCDLEEKIAASGVEKILEQTRTFSKKFLAPVRKDFDGLPEKTVSNLFNRSLLTMATLAGKNGSIVAAADSDERYGYVWGRDGAMKADAISRAGLPEIPRRFFKFIGEAVREHPWLWQKFNPDGTLGASWHPWIVDGKAVLPVQEDETGLVLWALAGHIELYDDNELLTELYDSLVKRGADWMVEYRDEKTKLPLPSWDLWEERRGVHLWTCAAVVGGLRGAAKLAESNKKAADAKKWKTAADEIAEAIDEHFWNEELNRYVRTITLKDDGEIEQDESIDVSMCGVFLLDCKAADDERVRSTVEAIREKLKVKTEVGGWARYEGDVYQQVEGSEDDDRVPGNPWFVCSLWITQADIAAAKTPEELEMVKDAIDWACRQGDDAKILAEQINPYTGESLSVSPLGWSHAEIVRTVNAYLEKNAELSKAKSAQSN